MAACSQMIAPYMSACPQMIAPYMSACPQMIAPVYGSMFTDDSSMIYIDKGEVMPGSHINEHWSFILK